MAEPPATMTDTPSTPAATDLVAVLVTGPDADALAALGRRLVEERLAACLNVLPGARSVYRWEGRVVDEPEAVGILKTVRACLPRLLERAAELHPYDVPELVALEVAAVAPPYLAWVRDAVADGEGPA
ncbi:MAG: divalent-cation tolerance protein CutA [Gemmatimonadota bacterium]|nr:divalent-cation tolerance protein CutA [Gemmatimonadota bacterium]